jgi:haloacetate dehalogenase
MFAGFTATHINAADSSIFVRHGGSGPPVILLHGHPRTSATWHRVAPLLAERGYTVICPDLRGYGQSSGPAPAADHSTASKRAMANDILYVARELGHERFHLVGHDRGSYVALRLALDHPQAVKKLVLMDCLPISEHLQRADARFATAWWHWFFFAQPDIPERVIGADPEGWYAPKAVPATMGQENHAELMRAIRNPAVVRAMLEDYRAGLTVDREDEEADVAAGNKLRPHTLVLWSTRDDLPSLYGDPLEIWRSWTQHEPVGFGIDSGHHIAEEASGALTDALVDFLSNPDR